MRRLWATGALCAVLALGLAACIPPTEPASNGRLPESSLTTVTPSCRILNELAAPLRTMMDAAKADGVQLQPEVDAYYVFQKLDPPEPSSCYRSYDLQVWWRNLYCYVGTCQFAAVPGTSIHGWGRAVDFQDQLGELQFTSPGYAWLQAHAAAYGFFHPAWAEPGTGSSEPWHWEHS
jgi:LAS superfamily LD-carboxypeptidase LdcB